MDVVIPSLGHVQLPPKASGVGGSGSVYKVKDLAVKILHPQFRTAEAEKRVLALCQFPADSRFAIPREVVSDTAGGKFVGFAMPWVDGVPLLCLLDTLAARKQGVSFTLLERLTAALQLADLYMAAHLRLKALVGDGNESNFFVVRDPRGHLGLVAIDLDEFGISFRDPVTGQFVTAKPERGKEPYLSPALQGVDLRTVDRTEDDDAFSLAALLFHLVTGVQAFAVRTRPGASPPGPVGKRIKRGLWPYGPKVVLPAGWVPAAASTWAALPKDIQDLFVACFVDGHMTPALRPRPATWLTALSKWVQAEEVAPRFTAGSTAQAASQQQLPSLAVPPVARANLIVRALMSLAPARAAWWLLSRAGVLRGMFAYPQPIPPAATAPTPGGSTATAITQPSGVRFAPWLIAAFIVAATAAVTGFVLWPQHATAPPAPDAPKLSAPIREGDHPRWRDAPPLWRELLNEDDGEGLPWKSLLER